MNLSQIERKNCSLKTFERRKKVLSEGMPLVQRENCPDYRLGLSLCRKRMPPPACHKLVVKGIEPVLFVDFVIKLKRLHFKGASQREVVLRPLRVGFNIYCY